MSKDLIAKKEDDDKKDKSKKANIIIAAFFILIILISILYNWNKKIHLEAYKKYTLGITNGTFFNIRYRTTTLYFYYYVDNVKYESDEPYNPNKHKIIETGGQYYVKYNYLDPSSSEIMLDVPVRKGLSINTVPINGWDSIPE